MSTQAPIRWQVDFTNLMAPHLSGFGLDPDQVVGALAERFTNAMDVVMGWRGDGRLGFVDLPESDGAIESQRLAERAVGGVHDVIVLGIGGSALGTRTVRDALGGVRWNEWSPEQRGGRPRLHVLDNPDPDLYRTTMAGIDPRTTLVNVVSKSGGTAETLALYQVVRSWMEREIGHADTRERLVFTTDPERGPLRAIAAEEGIATLDVPPNVGGRFSVLTPVGLFPAALLGFDPTEMLRGAREMERAASRSELLSNPAALLAVALHWFDQDAGCPIHVLMP